MWSRANGIPLGGPRALRAGNRSPRATLPQPRRVGAASRPHPLRGSKRQSYLDATRTRGRNSPRIPCSARFPAARYVALAYAAADRYPVRLPSPRSSGAPARRNTMCLVSLADSVAGETRHEPHEGAAVPEVHDARTWRSHDRRYVSSTSAGVPSGQRHETRGAAAGLERSLPRCEKRNSEGPFLDVACRARLRAVPREALVVEEPAAKLYPCGRDRRVRRHRRRRDARRQIPRVLPIRARRPNGGR